MSKHNDIQELSHHGIPGMKWGIRRYQNRDGSLTSAGRKRVAKMKEEYTQLTGKRLIRKPSTNTNKSKDGEEEKKSVKDMSTEELRKKTDRLNAEKNYIDAVNNRRAVEPAQVTKGEKFAKTVMNDIIAPAAVDTGKQLVKSYMTKFVNESLELDEDYKIFTNNKRKN